MTRRGSDFDDFVAGAAAGLHRMAYALTGERAAAEDLVQDVLERMFVAWPRVDEPLAYARRALVNRSANRWRSRARRREVALAEPVEIPVADTTDHHGRRDQLVRAISTLPPRQRSVVVLRFLADLSEAETAAALGCSAGTVKSQTSRALARLREVLAVSESELVPGQLRSNP